MSRSRGRSAQSVSLFPFLAVLVCAMGALILLLIVTTRRIRSDAIARAEAARQTPREVAPEPATPIEPVPFVVGLDPWPGQLALGISQHTPFVFTPPEPEVEKPPPPPAPPWHLFTRRPDPPDPNAELRQRLAAVTADRDRAGGVTARARSDAEAAAKVVAGLMEMLTSVRGGVDEAARQAARLQAAVAEASGKAERIRGQLAKTTQQIDAARRQHAAEPTKYALLPFDGRTGTNLRPVLIELTGEGLRFVPEDVLLRPEDFDGFTEGVNPLEAGAKALLTHWAEVRRRSSGAEPPPYVLLIIRPSGAQFFTARRLLERLGGPIGYELLPEDAPLALPPADPEATAACRRAITDLVAERDRLSGLLVGGRGNGFGNGFGDGYRDGPDDGEFGRFGRTGRFERTDDGAVGSGGDPLADRLRGGIGRAHGDFQPPRVARPVGPTSPADTPGGSRTGSGEYTAARPLPDAFVPPAPAATDSPGSIAGRDGHPGTTGIGSTATARLGTTHVPLAPSPAGVAGVNPRTDVATNAASQSRQNSVPNATPNGVTNSAGAGGVNPATEMPTNSVSQPSQNTIPNAAPNGVAHVTSAGPGSPPSPGATARPGTSGQPGADAAGSRGGGGGETGPAVDDDLPDFAALFLRHRLRPDEKPRRRWGYADPRASIGFERDVPVEVYPDHLIVGGTYLVRTERAREPEEVSVWMLEAVERKARSWGVPPTSFYWVPTLTFRVAPGAEPLYGRLRKTADEWSLRSSVRRIEPNTQGTARPTGGGTP